MLSTAYVLYSKHNLHVQLFDTCSRTVLSHTWHIHSHKGYACSKHQQLNTIVSRLYAPTLCHQLANPVLVSIVPVSIVHAIKQLLSQVLVGSTWFA